MERLTAINAAYEDDTAGQGAKSSRGEEYKYGYTIVPAPFGIEADTNKIPSMPRCDQSAIDDTTILVLIETTKPHPPYGDTHARIIRTSGKLLFLPTSLYSLVLIRSLVLHTMLLT